jgi:hypothetical protein
MRAGTMLKQPGPSLGLIPVADSRRDIFLLSAAFICWQRFFIAFGTRRSGRDSVGIVLRRHTNRLGVAGITLLVG